LSACGDEAGSQQVELGAAIHLSFYEFESGNLSAILGAVDPHALHNVSVC
jgi:hypothetical protein